MCQLHKLGILLHNFNILYCFNILQAEYFPAHLYFLVSEILLESFVNKY